MCESNWPKGQTMKSLERMIIFIMQIMMSEGGKFSREMNRGILGDSSCSVCQEGSTSESNENHATEVGRCIRATVGTRRT